MAGLHEDGIRRDFLSHLAMVSEHGLSGNLVYEQKSGMERHLEFFFHRGQLLYATSKAPGERLGEFLARRGTIGEKDLPRFLAEARRYELYFHAYLAEAGIIEYEELKDLLYERTEKLIGSITSEKKTLIFRPVQPDSMAGPVWINEELFRQLLEHRNVWPRLYHKFQEEEITLRASEEACLNPAYFTLGTKEQRLLHLLQKPTEVSRLCRGRKDRFQLMLLLERLLDSKLLVIQSPNRETVGGFRLNSAPGIVARQAGARLQKRRREPYPGEVLLSRDDSGSKTSTGSPRPPRQTTGEAVFGHRVGSNSFSVVDNLSTWMKERSGSGRSRARIFGGIVLLLGMVLLPLWWYAYPPFGQTKQQSRAEPTVPKTGVVEPPEQEEFTGLVANQPEESDDQFEPDWEPAEGDWSDAEENTGEERDESKAVMAPSSRVVVEGREVRLENLAWTPNGWRRRRATEQRGRREK